MHSAEGKHEQPPRKMQYRQDALQTEMLIGESPCPKRGNYGSNGGGAIHKAYFSPAEMQGLEQVGSRGNGPGTPDEELKKLEKSEAEIECGLQGVVFCGAKVGIFFSCQR